MMNTTNTAPPIAGDKIDISPLINVRELTMAYGRDIIQSDLTFTVDPGDIFIIMGGSGCGKSTLLRHLVGLKKPKTGTIAYKGVDFWNSSPKERIRQMQDFGILYQSGALWSSMTLGQNVALPLEIHTRLSSEQIREQVLFKLSLVGLAPFQNHYPSQISGGMRKRAGLARAMAMDPDILFFDEPSAGLDPISARRLDDLILEIRESFGTTVVVVTHELASIFAIGSNSVFLDSETRTMIAGGHPRKLLETTRDKKIIEFLTRGEGQ